MLHLLGIDDSGTVTVSHLGVDVNRSRLTYLGNVELTDLMTSPDLHVTTLIRGGMHIEGRHLPAVDVVVNAVCDCDTNAHALRSVASVVRQVGRPVVNDPELVLRTGRDHMHETLRDMDGVRCPRTVRVSPRSTRELAALVEGGDLAVPFLFREAGAHGGQKLELVIGIADADLRQLDRFAFDGRQFYATEFVDFASPDGLYRKYRVIVIGDRPFPRHLIISDSWNIHSESRDVLMASSEELRAEEARHILGFEPADHPVFTRLWERLGLDYFGIDFAVTDDGTLVVFEINCCCRPLTRGVQLGAHHETLVADMTQAFTDLLWERSGVPRRAEGP